MLENKHKKKSRIRKESFLFRLDLCFHFLHLKEIVFHYKNIDLMEICSIRSKRNIENFSFEKFLKQ